MNAPNSQTQSITEDGFANAHQPLGTILIDDGQITDNQLQQALSEQQLRGERLGQLLCRLGHVDQATLRNALVKQANVPVVEFDKCSVDPDAVHAISPEFAFRNKVFAFATQNGSLHLAMCDPFDRDVIDAARVLTSKRIKRYYCSENELLEQARKVYGSNVARMIADLAPTAIEQSDIVDLEQPADEQQLASQLQQMAREPSVVNLVNLIIMEAIEARASDIHIEPFETTIKVKYRIDGVLHEMSPPPKKLQPAIISRVKIMAGMNIAERFVPQDGHITFTRPTCKVDLRVATVPTLFGECLVMRILDRSQSMIGLQNMGFSPKCHHSFTNMLDKPHGIVLVTGPTGSGKTTTLYGALQHIYSPEKKIITIEDPVEYQLEGINQIPVNPKRGLSFANGLRAILRQDPDIIMVGEIRDRETADIAIRSALTGHLVFSTLHTNDAAGAVTRLLDMGVEPFLLASSLEGVIAQRLVRTICPQCRKPYDPPPEVLDRLSHLGDDGNGVSFYHGEGCKHCRNTGYLGRIGIFELLRITPRVRDAILHSQTAVSIAGAASDDHEPMRDDGFRKATTGVTTVEEVLRVTHDAQNDTTSE